MYILAGRCDSVVEIKGREKRITKCPGSTLGCDVVSF